jgi:hypothetical protein
MSIGHNKYTVAQRLLAVESELGDLRKLVQSIELKEGKQGLPGATGASGRDGLQGIPGRDGKDAVGIQGIPGRDGRSIQGQKGDRGLPGRDGKDSTVPGPQGPPGESIVGPRGEKGERGDVLIPNETELQQAVIALRLKLLEQRAAFVGRILQGIKDNESGNKVQQHFSRHLESILRDIEAL